MTRDQYARALKYFRYSRVLRGKPRSRRYVSWHNSTDVALEALELLGLIWSEIERSPTGNISRGTAEVLKERFA